MKTEEFKILSHRAKEVALAIEGPGGFTENDFDYISIHSDGSLNAHFSRFEYNETNGTEITLTEEDMASPLEITAAKYKKIRDEKESTRLQSIEDAKIKEKEESEKRELATYKRLKNKFEKNNKS